MIFGATKLGLVMYQEALLSLSPGRLTQERCLHSRSCEDHGLVQEPRVGGGGWSQILTTPTLLEGDLRAGCNREDWTDFLHFNLFQLEQRGSCCGGFPGDSVVKSLPAMQEILGQEDPLEEETATLSSVLSWETPWTEEPGRVRGIARAGQNLATELPPPPTKA